MNDLKNSLLFFAGLLCKIVAKLIFFLSSFDILQRDSINMRQLIADFIEGRHLSWSLLKRNCFVLWSSYMIHVTWISLQHCSYSQKTTWNVIKFKFQTLWSSTVIGWRPPAKLHRRHPPELQWRDLSSWPALETSPPKLHWRPSPPKLHWRPRPLNCSTGETSPPELHWRPILLRCIGDLSF